MDAAQLVSLRIEHEVGVTKTQPELYELPD